MLSGTAGSFDVALYMPTLNTDSVRFLRVEYGFYWGGSLENNDGGTRKGVNIGKGTLVLSHLRPEFIVHRNFTPSF
jgi:hypothetical protein